MIAYAGWDETNTAMEKGDMRVPREMSDFERFLYGEADRYRGISYPVKTGYLRRLVTEAVPCAKLHPNPADEFCMPEIGPKWEIVRQYEEEIQTARRSGGIPIFPEPITVEKMYPDGYMILNGHHRWAAAVRMQVEKVPVRIVNLTQASDLKKMMRNARHTRRITLDLDEVVFFGGETGEAEKPLGFPLNRIYREPMRRGVPSLFHFARRLGYDIWLYSSRYDSGDYIRHYFRHYGIRPDGVITGLKSGRPGIEQVRTEMERLSRTMYPITLHIDDRTMLCIDREKRRFRDFELSGRADSWAWEVMDFIGEYEKDTSREEDG